MTCRMITSPVTGEQRMSNFWDALYAKTNSEEIADKIMQKTIGKDYIQKYGDWLQGSSSLAVDANGEPLITKSFLNTLSNVDFQKNDLKNKLINFLKTAGFTYEEVASAYNSNFESISGVTDFLLQTVKVSEGAPLNTLPEEAGHVYVEMLKQKKDPLYDFMMKYITTSEIYNEVLKQYGEIYQNDEIKLKEEAIGKAIAYRINNVPFISSVVADSSFVIWLKSVLKSINKYIGLNSEQLEAYLDLAKDEILSKDATILNPVNYKMYDLTPSTQRAVLQIREIDKKLIKKETVIDGKTVEVYEIDGKRTKRISDFLKTLSDKMFGKDKSAEQNIASEYARETGVFGHADLENIVKRYLEGIKGVPEHKKTPLMQNLKNGANAVLTAYVHDLLGNFSPNSVILTEVKVYNKKTNTAGTIDLLIIEPNGKVHIFDYKFINIEKGNITAFTKKLWNIQLNSYKDTLAEYGLKDIGMMRMLPIKVVYADKKYQEIKIDGKTLLEKSQPARNEKTGDKELDSLLLRLFNEYKVLEENKPKGRIAQNEKNSKLFSLSAVINEIQTKKNINGFTNLVKRQLNSFEQILANGNVSFSELRAMDDYSNYYANIVNLNLTKEISRSSPATKEAIATIGYRSQILRLAVENKLKEHLDNKKIDVNFLGLNNWGGYIATLGSFKNPIFRYFNRLKSQKEDTIDKEYNDYVDEVSLLVNKIKEEEKANPKGVYERILQYNEEGKPKGTLVKQYQPEYYEELAKATLPWMYKNIAIRAGAKEQFDAELAALIKAENQYNPEKAEANINQWRYKNDFWNSKYASGALMNYSKNSRGHIYLEPIAKWQSKEYNYLLNNKDKAISKLYFKFQDTIKLAREYAPTETSLPSTFIPNIEKRLLSQIISGSSVSAIKGSLVNSLNFKSYERPLDSFGNPIYTIPLKYTEFINSDVKSLDLGLVFSEFYHSVLQNKYLSEIEDESVLLVSALKLGTYYAKDNLGNIKIGESGYAEPIDISDSASFVDTQTQLKQFINNSIYLVKDETKDFTVGDVSGVNVLGAAQSYFSLLNIGLSPITAFGNVTGGMTMLYSLANKNRWFNKKDVIKANTLIASRNKTVMTLIDYFKIGTADTKYKIAQKASIEQMANHLTLDKAYVLQHGGDWLVQNSGLIAFLNAHSIEGGQLVKKTDTTKSILETVQDKDGKVDITGMNEEVFSAIRKKVRAINEQTLGALSEREILLAEKQLKYRILLQFKKWMLPMGKARFGNLTYNDNLEEFQEGNYRVFATIIGNGAVEGVKTLLELSSFLLPTVKNPSPNLKGKIEEQYNLLRSRNPQFSNEQGQEYISLEQYEEMYMQNLQSVIFDLQALVGVMLLLVSVKPEDEEEPGALRRFLYTGLNKTKLELSFWSNPSSFSTLANSGVPLVGLGVRVGDVLKNSIGVVFGDTETEKLTKSLSKITVGWNAYEKTIRQINTEQNK